MADTASPRIGLAVDSAGLACSVAVSLGEEVIAEERIATMHGQAEVLLPMVDRAMREAGQMAAALDFVIATVGPGSFTGIRVGLAVARGIALATGAQLFGVTSFDAAADLALRNIWRGNPFLLVALESRREDFYVQFFDSHGDALRESAAIMPPLFRETVAATIGANPLLIAGDAAQRAAAALELRPDTAVLEDSAPGAAGALRAGLRLARFGKAADAPRPLYLRPPDVRLPETTLNRSRTRT